MSAGMDVMNLDWRVCSRARLARDPRFDGKFFIAVLSTGIYCRPICRSRPSLEKNVRYFSTAAAAAEAGFRPCLRCRPESSPATPVWVGTQNTVSRALRLISELGLEDGGVEALAGHLGVGARHLRRLFLRHLGASPKAVAQTRRLDFAKKLIDETSLPMAQIALASGFGCVRRFNAAIRKVYERTPTQIRGFARQKLMQPENEYLLHLHFRPPYDAKRLLEFLAARATPGVEAVEFPSYRRSISLNGVHGYFEATLAKDSNTFRVRVHIDDPRLLFAIVERIRAMLDVDADWEVIQQTLTADPLLAPRVEAYPGLRVPGCWDGFELAIRAILGQQVSVRRATDLAGRIVAAFGQPVSLAKNLTHLFPSPQTLADANLRGIGLIGARENAIRGLARAVCDGQISFGKIVHTDVFLERLCELPGIGEWTVQYIALRALREPDALPFADLGLLRALGLKSARELEQRSQLWRPWRAYAAMYLWSIHAEAKGRQSEPGLSAAAENQAQPRIAVAG